MFNHHFGAPEACICRAKCFGGFKISERLKMIVLEKKRVGKEEKQDIYSIQNEIGGGKKGKINRAYDEKQ